MATTPIVTYALDEVNTPVLTGALEQHAAHREQQTHEPLFAPTVEARIELLEEVARADQLRRTVEDAQSAGYIPPARRPPPPIGCTSRPSKPQSSPRTPDRPASAPIDGPLPAPACHASSHLRDTEVTEAVGSSPARDTLQATPACQGRTS